MRRFLIAALIAAMPLSAIATAAMPQISAEDTEVCDNLSSLASSIMTAHQNGSPMADIMSLVSEPSHQNLVIEIYQSPRYHSSSNKQSAIAEIRDSIAADCYAYMIANPS